MRILLASATRTVRRLRTTLITSSVEPVEVELMMATSSPFGPQEKSFKVRPSVNLQISRESVPSAFSTTTRCTPGGETARRFPSGEYCHGAVVGAGALPERETVMVFRDGPSWTLAAMLALSGIQCAMT